MKTFILKTASVLCIIITLAFSTYQENVPWTATQMMYPFNLVQKLNDDKVVKPTIICVGKVDLIKTAIATKEACSTLSGMEDFKYLVSKIAKDKEIIIYCGCCKFKSCPNVTAPFEYLNEAGYKNHKVLYLPSNLQDDWVSKGYPMEKVK